MNKTINASTSLAQAIRYFADPDVSLTFLAGLRWPEGPICPHCGGKVHSFLKTRRIWKCKGCKRQFSVKVGTIFEDSPIGLDKWLPALWLLANAKNGISSYELGRSLGVTQKTAWFMLHRVRLAVQSKTFGRLAGDVEIDETYIGGKARFMDPVRKRRVLRGRRGGMTGKTAVMGVLTRDARKGHSRVRVEMWLTEKVHKEQAREFINYHVEQGATVYTDEHRSFIQFRDLFRHKVIEHAVRYAKGKVHINGLENFWSLLKRGLKGTYVSVEPFHLFRYLDEQVFRFNTRKTKDEVPFIHTVLGAMGKRLTYSNLIGENLATT